MRELQDMLRVQARLHRKQGANALGYLLENAGKEIESLSEQLAKANERVSELEQWIAGIADSHNAIPDWIQHSARCMLAKEQEK